MKKTAKLRAAAEMRTWSKVEAFQQRLRLRRSTLENSVVRLAALGATWRLTTLGSEG